MTELNSEEGDNYISPVSKKFNLLAFSLGIPLYILLALNGHQDKGFIAGACVGVVIVLARAFWKLHRSYYYWLLLFFVCALHAAAVFALDFARPNFPIILAAMPIGFVDFIVFFLIFDRLGKSLVKKNSLLGAGK